MFDLSTKFIIIFEKCNNEYSNELFYYDIKSKIKTIKNNEIWKLNNATSYCIHESNNNDCLIYRVGGFNKDFIPNIKYSIQNDKHEELPLTQTKRSRSSTIHNMKHGLITIGGNNSNDGCRSFK